MSHDRISLGKQGERAALSHLKSCGFKILETNWRTKFAELDIIAMDNDTFCFTEVKTRQSLKKGLPREAVTAVKQKKIIQAALLYLKKNKLDDACVRFDVVEVLKENDTLSVNLIKHAFQAY